MRSIKRIESESGDIIVDIVEVERGFMIKSYARKYDEEEGRYFVTEIRPVTSSRYSDFESALGEAERLIGLD